MKLNGTPTALIRRYVTPSRSTAGSSPSNVISGRVADAIRAAIPSPMPPRATALAAHRRRHPRGRRVPAGQRPARLCRRQEVEHPHERADDGRGERETAERHGAEPADDHGVGEDVQRLDQQRSECRDRDGHDAPVGCVETTESPVPARRTIFCDVRRPASGHDHTAIRRPAQSTLADRQTLSVVTAPVATVPGTARDPRPSDVHDPPRAFRRCLSQGDQHAPRSG